MNDILKNKLQKKAGIKTVLLQKHGKKRLQSRVFIKWERNAGKTKENKTNK